MEYVRVVFLKEVGAFVGSDGQVYGPYKPGDEAVIPIEDAKALALRGAVARVGGYIVEEGVKPSPAISRVPPQKMASLFSFLALMSIGFALIIVGFILMSISAMNVLGSIAIFPFPPIVISGSEAIVVAILPIVIILAFLIFFLYLAMRF